nr:hypothetical protein [Tanacetum cinerariifolium]
MAATGPGNIITRRVTNDLIAFSGETAVPKYMKFFLVQKVARTRRFVNQIRDEADVIRSCIAQTTAVITELQVMEDQDEVHDRLLVAKDAKHGEESKLLALHEVIVEALEESESQGNNVEMLDAYVALYSEEFNLMCCARFYDLGSSMPRFLIMVALYILDKLSEVANSSRLEDNIKVVFSQAWDSDESFIELLRELCSAIRVTIIKDRRLIAELEALG